MTQIVYSLLELLKSDLHLDLDSWGVLIFAAICHDVGSGSRRIKKNIERRTFVSPLADHPGVANSFLKNSCDALYILYGDSGTLEHHHFSTLCKILHHRDNDIFTNILDKYG